MSDSQDYPLGYSDEEARRLAAQAALLKDITADLFRRAGLRPGMQVLDVGSGVGDVAFLAASMVGPDGTVLGIDRAASSVETARRRAAELAVRRVRFEQADVATFETAETFDAIVGRLVLLYLPDPVGVVRQLSRHLRPGGVVAFQEYDISQVSQAPEGELFVKVRRWLLEAFAAGGVELDMGTRLYSTLLHAGLPPPSMIAATQIACGPSSPGYEYITGVVRSLLPVIERSGIASAAEVGIDSLAQRLRADALANERVAFLPRIVGAWTAAGEAHDT